MEVAGARERRSLCVTDRAEGDFGSAPFGLLSLLFAAPEAVDCAAFLAQRASDVVRRGTPAVGHCKEIRLARPVGSDHDMSGPSSGS